ncbi:hypothetical protein [Flammeovirga aprica]|uniref:Glycosyltransferase RgtA/B/C/D-like domain-containing protein n=1 Tax=Flammeovirga aprica JL-4 TaxID=694437 RepID=A0A7X9RRQ2_9BACT|nr:hypothetical protein [Flammeovirga aprica]NME66390.1 hypothetical protein [Flammeovirga aprica JL-4]
MIDFLNSRKVGYTVVSVMYVILSMVIYDKYGVKVVTDSGRYLESSENVFELIKYQGHNFWYLGYILFLFVLRSIYDNLHFVIAIQYILSFASVLLLFESLFIITKRYKISTILAVIYILNLEVISWNSYILCESFYISCIITLIYFYLNLSEKWSRLLLTVCILFSIFVVFIKPTGVSVLIAIVVLYWNVLSKNKAYQKYKLLLIPFLLLGIIALIKYMLLTFEVPSDYIKGDIIYNISAYTSVLSKYPYLKQTSDSLLVLDDMKGDTLTEIIQFIRFNFLFWIKLFFIKVFFFGSHVRPYWSLVHNMNSIIILLPIYSLIVVAFFKGKLKNTISRVMISFILCNAVIVGCTVVDWDGRFFMPIYPVLLLLSSFFWKVSLKSSTH